MSAQSKSMHTAGQDIYERANDARRKGEHDNYIRLCRELDRYNKRIAAAKGGAA